MTDTFTLLHGRLTLHNVPPRPSEDGQWLATFSNPPPHARVLDAMCGCGVVGLAMLVNHPTLSVIGIDVDSILTELANRNAHLNKLDKNYHAITSSLEDYTPTERFDLVVMNPPYHAISRGHTTSSTSRSQVKSLPNGKLNNWLLAAINLLTPKGCLNMIVHSACISEIQQISVVHKWTCTTHITPTPKRTLVQITR